MKTAKEMMEVTNGVVNRGSISASLAAEIEYSAEQGRYYCELAGLSAADEHRLTTLGYKVKRGNVGQGTRVSWEK